MFKPSSVLQNFRKNEILILFLCGCPWLGCTDLASEQVPTGAELENLKPSPIQCQLEGIILSVGESTPAADGCNTCVCTEGGTLFCSTQECPTPEENEEDTDIEEGDGMDDQGEGENDDNPCIDRDDDGFFPCENPDDPDAARDCDDNRWSVQPGGYEFPGNGIDDDCDGLIDEGPDCACEGSSDFTLDPGPLSAAFELCDEGIESASATGQPLQFAVVSDFFGDIQPMAGECLAVLSTGYADGRWEADYPPEVEPEDANGVSASQPGTDMNGIEGHHFNFFPDPDPEVEEPTMVYDLAQLKMALKAPSNARGFSFKFMFLSTEWPEYLCLNYNDTFYTLMEGTLVNEGMPKNISFDPNDRPITVNVGFFELPAQWSTSLDSTPFGAEHVGVKCPVGWDLELNGDTETCTLPTYCEQAENSDLAFAGSGSGWLVTNAPVQPGESFDLTFSIHDEGDAVLDSTVIIDDFQWLPSGPDVNTVKPTDENP